MSSTGAAPATATQSAASGSSKMFSWGTSIFIGIGLLTYLGTFITTLTLVGSSDSWSSIKGNITGVLVSSLVGGIAFATGIVLLVISKPYLTSWLPTLISGLALTVAIAAVCVAAISR